MFFAFTFKQGQTTPAPPPQLQRRTVSRGSPHWFSGLLNMQAQHRIKGTFKLFYGLCIVCSSLLPHCLRVAGISCIGGGNSTRLIFPYNVYPLALLHIAFTPSLRVSILYSHAAAFEVGGSFAGRVHSHAFTCSRQLRG